MSTTFWDLCSDVILEICSYFSIDELYVSLYPDCLPYLFELLRASHMKLHLCLTNDVLLTSILLSLIDVNQISSLRLSFCDISLTEFNTLKALTFNNVKNNHQVISQPWILPSLQRLNLIYSEHFDRLTEHVLTRIFARSSLQYLKIESSDDFVAPFSTSFRPSSSIKELVLNISCTHSTMNFFLTHLPNLHILRIRTLISRPSTRIANPLAAMNVVLPSSVHHPTLRILDLVWYHPTMIDITALLSGLSNLKRCRLTGVMNFQELKGKVWHHLITQTCANLMQMNVNMLIWTGNKAEEIKTDFDQDTFFQRLEFELFPSDKEKELFILFGDFQHFVE